MYTDLPSFIDISTTKTLKMKVWSPQIATIVMKLENPRKPGAQGTSGDYLAQITTPNQWTELTYDFSIPNPPTPPISDDGEYQRIALIFGFDEIPATDIVYYFDDIRLEGGSCETTSVFEGNEVKKLEVFPNPTNGKLYVRNGNSSVVLKVFNLLGQEIVSTTVIRFENSEIDLSSLTKGIYFVGGFDENGFLIEGSKVVKE
jgi:hypothetical protein